VHSLPSGLQVIECRRAYMPLTHRHDPTISELVGGHLRRSRCCLASSHRAFAIARPTRRPSSVPAPRMLQGFSAVAPSVGNALTVGRRRVSERRTSPTGAART
jgi:hypothetical protein